MNKKQIIDKIVNDLPTSDMRGEMTKEEWYGWFEECWDKAINYTRCCKSDSEQLPSKEKMNIKLYALADELKTDDKQTEKIYFESGFRYCQQVIKEHLRK